MEEQEGQTGSGGHPSRYDMSGKRHLLISTCGFYTAKNNYDSVTKLFDHVCGAGQYESIFCGQGELFRVPELRRGRMNIWNASDRRGANTHRNRRSQKTRRKS